MNDFLKVFLKYPLQGSDLQPQLHETYAHFLFIQFVQQAGRTGSLSENSTREYPRPEHVEESNVNSAIQRS